MPSEHGKDERIDADRLVAHEIGLVAEEKIERLQERTPSATISGFGMAGYALGHHRLAHFLLSPAQIIPAHGRVRSSNHVPGAALEVRGNKPAEIGEGWAEFVLDIISIAIACARSTGVRP